MKIDSAILESDLDKVGAEARRLEELGYDGGFTFEGPHDPFLPLVTVAQATEKLEISTAIAVAFARSPMLLANIGYDLQAHSKGRFPWPHSCGEFVASSQMAAASSAQASPTSGRWHAAAI